MSKTANHGYRDRLTANAPEPQPRWFKSPPTSYDDLEKAVDPKHSTSSDIRRSGYDDTPKIPVRSCPSAGTLAPELAMFTPTHAEPRDAHQSYVTASSGWYDRLLDHAKANICVAPSPEQLSDGLDLAADVGTMQALAVYILQGEIAHAGRQIIEGELPVGLQELLHNYCKSHEEIQFCTVVSIQRC